jgi:hypothetical protein
MENRNFTEVVSGFLGVLFELRGFASSFRSRQSDISLKRIAPKRIEVS